MHMQDYIGQENAVHVYQAIILVGGALVQRRSHPDLTRRGSSLALCCRTFYLHLLRSREAR